MAADYRAEGAGRPGRRWLAARRAASPWPASAVLAGAVLVTFLEGPGIPQEGGRLVVTVVACVPIVVLRRWPLLVLGLLTAGAGLVAARGGAALPFGILLGLALYLAALDWPRRRSLLLTGLVAAVITAAIAYAGYSMRNPPVAAEAVENLVPLVGAWFIADSVAARRRYEAGLAAQAGRERAAEVREERVRIAREMHDVVAHALAVITVQAGVGRCLADRHPEEATAALASIETVGRTAQDELRVMLGLLRDGETGAAPLAPAPRLADVADLADTVRASGVPVELRLAGTDRGLSPALELSIYRVLQEALTNVVKHAPGARAVAELTVSARTVRLDVRDDGGPATGPAAGDSPGTGHGIVGMRERIGAFGGWLTAGPAAGGGFRVTAEVPIEGGAR